MCLRSARLRRGSALTPCPCQVALLLDFKLDESYTPSRVAVRAGTTVHDLRELQTVDLEEPVGWVPIPLRLPNSTCAAALPRRRMFRGSQPALLRAPAAASRRGALMSSCPRRRLCLKAYFVQLAILTNHQNGRDTHIRQVRIFGPRLNTMHALGHPVGFTTDEFCTYATLR